MKKFIYSKLILCLLFMSLCNKFVYAQSENDTISFKMSKLELTKIVGNNEIDIIPYFKPIIRKYGAENEIKTIEISFISPVMVDTITLDFITRKSFKRKVDVRCHIKYSKSVNDNYLVSFKLTEKEFSKYKGPNRLDGKKVFTNFSKVKKRLKRMKITLDTITKNSGHKIRTERVGSGTTTNEAPEDPDKENAKN